MPATDKYFRDIKATHVVFAISGLLFCLTTFWMMVADHDDEWRQVQRTADQLDAELLRNTMSALESRDYRQQVDALKQQLDQAQTQLDSEDDRRAELSQAVRNLEFEVDRFSRRLKNQSAQRDVARANYDLAIRDNLPKAILSNKLGLFEDRQKDVDKTARELEDETTILTKTQEQLNQLTTERDLAESALATLQSDVDRAEVALTKIEPDNLLSSFKRQMMEWPIIDGFNSHLAIRQDWLPDLMITLGMAKTARFDRCRTCHVNADRANGKLPALPFGHPKSDDIQEWISTNSYPHPFASHSRPDVYTTAASPHPVETFGCTICHDGNGSGTSFQNGEHTPNNPFQGQQWSQDHHYHHNHFWEYPMQPDRFIESSCLKCHHDVVELGVNPEYGPTAPKVYEGFQLIEKYGCFGCHEIRGYDGLTPIGPDLRLEPSTPEARAAAAADPTKVPGRMRKVGPALAHIGTKTDADWIQYWTEQPSRFRPNTRMPQFFNLSNQHDEMAARLQPVELRAIASYLTAKSQPLELDHPHPDFQPDAERGKTTFIQRGCLACHSHDDVPLSQADFGPNLTYVHEKLKRNTNDADFSDWLYTWVRNPERHHPRTKMPNLFLNERSGDGTQIDPAADIVAFLLQGSRRDRPKTPRLNTQHLDELAKLFLSKALTEQQVNGLLADGGRYPFLGTATIKGDEIELVRRGTVVEVSGEDDKAILKVTFDQPVDGLSTDAELIWKTGELVNSSFTITKYSPEIGQLTLAPKMPVDPVVGDEFLVSTAITQSMKLHYVGRRTIGRYGCYGCHAIPGFETARPIGTALQDWGRKDTSKLAVEHIAEWLHHHGEPQPDGAQTGTQERAEGAMTKSRAGGFAAGEFPSQQAEDSALSAAFYYDNLLHHGRPGFIWQKLRQPRSYDYKKEETKGYDERLKMPKFPFDENEIEKVATFVLGLVAEPPAEQYLFRPTGAKAARFQGERLIEKYNCAACHMLELPQLRYADPELVRTGKFLADSKLKPNETRVQFDHSGAAANLGAHLEWTRGKLKGQTYHVASSQGQVLTLDRDLAAQPAASDTFVLNNVVSDTLNARDSQLALDRLLKLRPPLQSVTDQTVLIRSGSNADVEGQDENPQMVPVIEVPGMLVDKYNLEDVEEPDDPYSVDRYYTFELWYPRLVRDARWLPKKRLTVLEHRLADPIDRAVKQETDTTMQRLQSLIAAVGGDPQSADYQQTVAQARQKAFQQVGLLSNTFLSDPASLKRLRTGGRELVRSLQADQQKLEAAITARGSLAAARAAEPARVDTLLSRMRSLSVEIDRRYQESAIGAPRGGALAEFLVRDLLQQGAVENINEGWERVPPPLVGEGRKVQTPWLYQFLKNPNRIRRLTMLRMPKFNLSDHEAQTLANYFAAVDDAPYPYQAVPEREPPYLASQDALWRGKLQDNNDYLTESWKILNGKVCAQCHSIGGFVARRNPGDAKTAFGPNLANVSDRLRPDWTQVWIYNPAWVLPYTRMPQNFLANGKSLFPNLLQDNNAAQAIAVRDALFNYHMLLEREGHVYRYKPDLKAAPAPGGTE